MNEGQSEEVLSMLERKIKKMRTSKKKKAKRPLSEEVGKIQEELRKRLNAFLDFESADAIRSGALEEESLPSEEILESYKDICTKFQEKGSRYYQRDAADDANENDASPNQESLEPNARSNQDTDSRAGLDRKPKKLTRKQQKELLKTKLAQLKVLVERPDLVESWDVTAPDPLLLVYLKSYKNTIEVPKHWSQKKKFLQTKRGAFKRAFRLPEFIENTGISKLRDPLSEISSLKMIRQKIKERMNPRLGKIDIDYQTLHDAFFKYQTKPRMSLFGDVYYEGKEEDQRMRTYRPGKLSPELRTALGISEASPAPWILNMHKFGPPPSYPSMKISGLGLDAFKVSGDKKATNLEDDKYVEWAWEDESHAFGALREDKLDDEEVGFELENDFNEAADPTHEAAKNQENPYFKLDFFHAE